MSRSPTARKYGPALFKSQALTWREAAILENDPERGQQIIEDKQQRFEDIADKVQEEDPAAYEYLTGQQSDTRVGYAILGTVATFLALPFLLVSALLLIGSFLVVRLAVMLFPAFATLGLFPPARGIVINTGRVVGAALVNAVVFGVGAAVTVLGIGLILNPASQLPGWLALVLMPVFSFVMWFALKPFRRLIAMTGAANVNPLGEAAASFGNQSRRIGRVAKRAGVLAAASFAGNAAAAKAATTGHDDDGTGVPDRVEAQPTATPPASEPVPPAVTARSPGAAPQIAQTPAPGPTEPPRQVAQTPGPAQVSAAHPDAVPAQDMFVPRPSEAMVSDVASEPEWVDGEEVYAIYRPDRDRTGSDSAA